LGETIGNVVLVSRHNAYRSLVQVYHGTDAIPLEFVNILWSFRWLGRILREHRLNVAMKVVDLRRVYSFQQPLFWFDLIYPIFTGDLAAAETEVKSIFLFLRDLVLAEGIDPHVTGAVLTFWNPSVERQILPRVVFRLNRESFHTGMWRESFRYCPGLEHTILFKAKVVVQP